jgi:hypothetical protein
VSGFFVRVPVDELLTHQSTTAVWAAVGATKLRWANGQDGQALRASSQHFAVFKVKGIDGRLPQVA